VVLLTVGAVCLAGVLVSLVIVRRSSVTKAKRRVVLEVIAGPSRGLRIQVHKAAVSIGRHPASDLVLQDATVSRAHALVLWSGDAWEVRDAGSQSGTKVNGLRVTVQRLNSGDVITVGESAVRFLFAEPAR